MTKAIITSSTAANVDHQRPGCARLCHLCKTDPSLGRVALPPLSSNGDAPGFSRGNKLDKLGMHPARIPVAGFQQHAGSQAMIFWVDSNQGVRVL